MTAAPAQIENTLPSPEGGAAPKRSFLDALGIGLSALCMVHCLAMPAVLVVLPQISEIAGFDRTFHIVLAILLPGVAAVALAIGYARHREHITLALGGLGLAFIWFALTIPCSSCASCASGDPTQAQAAVPMMFGLPLHNLVNSVGSVLLISAHAINWRACRRGCCAEACHTG
ncbi:MAG: MerC domain-containing protein [Planctomycetota bacterium]